MGDHTHIQLQLITPVSFSVIKRIASVPPNPIPPPEELFLLIFFLSPPPLYRIPRLDFPFYLLYTVLTGHCHGRVHRKEKIFYMTKTKTYTGYCPTQGKDASITVQFSHVSGLKYIQTSADCPYASFVQNKCNIMNECPIRKLAPQGIFE